MPDPDAIPPDPAYLAKRRECCWTAGVDPLDPILKSKMDALRTHRGDLLAELEDTVARGRISPAVRAHVDLSVLFQALASWHLDIGKVEESARLTRQSSDLLKRAYELAQLEAKYRKKERARTLVEIFAREEAK